MNISISQMRAVHKCLIRRMYINLLLTVVNIAACVCLCLKKYRKINPILVQVFPLNQVVLPP